MFVLIFKKLKAGRSFSILVFCFGLACSKTDPNLTELLKGKSEEEQALVIRGAEVYRASCVSCHNFDPRERGSVGPAVSGSSLELLSARILNAEYPAGYMPKENTQKMMKMPHLKNQIPALHQYLEAYTELQP